MELRGSDQKRLVEMLEALLPAMTEDKAEGQRIADMLRAYNRIGYNKNSTKQELLQRAKIQPMLAKMRNNLKEVINGLLQKAGTESLTRAMQSGLLELHTFRASDTWDTQNMVTEFVEIIKDALSNGATYPLFDDQTGNLVRTGLKGGQIQVSEAGIIRGKHSGLAAQLLERLPVFDQASVNEILDIRRELEQPLTRFRSALITFSDKIRIAAWDEDFSFEAEQVFQRDLEPTILDLEEAVRTNKYLTMLLRTVVDKPLAFPSGSAIGILMSQISALPDIVTQGLGVGGASALLVHDAYKDWRKEQQKIEQNQLFFYYRAGNLLSNQTYKYRQET